MGPTRWAWNSNEVTTPKFPPPPRSAQNRSGWLVSLAVTTSPAAVTTWAETQVVAGQSEPALQHPHPAVQRQAADAGLGDLAGGYGQPEQLGLVVEVGQGGAALNPDALADRVDLDAAHQGQVDQQSVVAGAVPGDAVPAAAHRHRQARGAGETHGLDDVGGSQASDDHRRMAVDRCVVDRPGLVVARLSRLQRDPAQSGPELLEG